MEKMESAKAFQVEDEMRQMIESAKKDPVVDLTAERFFRAIEEEREFDAYSNILEDYKKHSENIDDTNTPIVRAMAFVLQANVTLIFTLTNVNIIREYCNEKFL